MTLRPAGTICTYLALKGAAQPPLSSGSNTYLWSTSGYPKCSLLFWFPVPHEQLRPHFGTQHSALRILQHRKHRQMGAHFNVFSLISGFPVAYLFSTLMENICRRGEAQGFPGIGNIRANGSLRSGRFPLHFAVLAAAA